MKRNNSLRLSFAVLAAAALFAVTIGLRPPKASAGATLVIPAQADVNDAYPDAKVRSDGGGVYKDGVNCVRSWVNSSSAAFMRTIHKDCMPQRKLVLDFSEASGLAPACDAVAGLYLCGSNTVPDAIIRAEDPSPFKNTNPTSTTVTIYFNLDTNSFQAPSAFILEFQQPVQVAGTGNARKVTAASGATAELFRRESSSGKSVNYKSVGVFKMPFEVTFTKLP